MGGVFFAALKDKPNIWLAVFLVTVFAVSRWPDLLPANFSVAYALVFCAGAFPRRLPWWLLLGVMLATDVGLNLCFYGEPPLTDYQAVNYLAYAAIYALGRQIGGQASWLRLLSGGLFGAVLFYLITNTAAWLQNPDYAKTVSGWFQALTVGTAGWPETWKFFRNTLTSGGLFTGLFAAAMKLSEASESAREKQAPEPAEEPADAPESATPEEGKA